MSSAATLYTTAERPGSDWFRDEEGVWSTSKHRDETKTYSIDWTDALASGETVSSVAYEASGVTTSGASLATPVSSVKVNGVGSMKVTATTSASRILVKTLRFYAEPLHRRVNDYNYSA